MPFSIHNASTFIIALRPFRSSTCTSTRKSRFTIRSYHAAQGGCFESPVEDAYLCVAFPKGDAVAIPKKFVPAVRRVLRTWKRDVHTLSVRFSDALRLRLHQES